MMMRWTFSGSFDAAHVLEIVEEDCEAHALLT